MKIKVGLTLLVTLTLVVSCTKHRDERFAQGQGKDLIAISDYDKKTFDLKTGNVLGKATLTPEFLN